MFTTPEKCILYQKRSQSSEGGVIAAVFGLYLSSTNTTTNTADYCFELNQLPQAQLNNLYYLPSVESRIVYIHAYLGYPTKAAILDVSAARRLICIPFTTATNIRRFYPMTTANPKGHLDQQRQGGRPTRQVQMQTQKASDRLTKKNNI